MVHDNHELLLELWSRLKSYVSPKERIEVADILVVVFDEFGLIEDDLLKEDLDKEMREAVRSHLSDNVYEEDYEDENDR